MAGVQGIAGVMQGSVGGYLADSQMLFGDVLVQTRANQYARSSIADGTSSAALSVPLPLNAVVRTFDVVVQARQAAMTATGAVAQLRESGDSGASDFGMSVVIDFGKMRTVSEVEVPSGLGIMSITSWIGTEFNPKPVYSAPVASSIAARGGSHQTVVIATAPSTGGHAILSSEIRTERLLVGLVGTADIETLAEEMLVRLPEAPSGLELRLEGGTVIWSHPAAPQLGAGTTLSDAAWSSDGRRIVHAAAALAAATGDPTGNQVLPFNLVLTSQVPGNLAVTEHARAVSVVRRMLFDGDSERTFEFESEGMVDIPLPLPAPAAGQGRAIEAIRFTALATPPPERVLPPVGPDPAGASDVPVLADLVLNPARAAIVRLRPASGLEGLVGIRLPLATGPDGAEARIVMWRNGEPGTAEPVEALADATSDPASLTGGAGEAWVTFAFPRPVPVDDANPPWAALLVTRGELTWSLGGVIDANDPIDVNLVRVGAPTGPWKPMPTPFQTGGGPLTALRGRLRVVGVAPKDRPLASHTVALAGVSGEPIEVTPTPKGTLVTMTFDPPLSQPGATLRLTGRTAGPITLRGVDVVATT